MGVRSFSLEIVLSEWPCEARIRKAEGSVGSIEV